MTELWMIVSIILLIEVGTLSATGQTIARYCNFERLQACLDAANRDMRGHSVDPYDAQRNPWHADSTCRAMRDNFNCIMENAPACAGRTFTNNISDTIWRTRQYLERVCEQDGGWRVRQCYKNQDLKNCELQYTAESRPVSLEACRSYNIFRDCTVNHVRTKCNLQYNPDSLELLHAYLVDIAQEVSWICPPDGADRTGSASNNPLFLSSSGSLRSPSSCLEKVTSYDVQNRCENTLLIKQREARQEIDGTDRQRKYCCALFNYRDCVYYLLREKCGYASQTDVDALIIQWRTELDQCSRYTAYDCSGTMNVTPTKGAIVISSFVVCLLTYFLKYVKN